MDCDNSGLNFLSSLYFGSQETQFANKDSSEHEENGWNWKKGYKVERNYLEIYKSRCGMQIKE